MEREVQVITIILHTDTDPAIILEIAQEYGQRIADDVESYGESVKYDEEEVSVTTE